MINTNETSQGEKKAFSLKGFFAKEKKAPPKKDYWDEERAKNESSEWLAFFHRGLANKLLELLDGAKQDNLIIVRYLLDFSRHFADRTIKLGDLRSLSAMRIFSGYEGYFSPDEADEKTNSLIKELFDFIRYEAQLANSASIRLSYVLNEKELEQGKFIVYPDGSPVEAMEVLNTDYPGLWIIKETIRINDGGEKIGQRIRFYLVGVKSVSHAKLDGEKVPTELLKKIEEKLDFPFLNRWDTVATENNSAIS